MAEVGVEKMAFGNSEKKPAKTAEVSVAGQKNIKKVYEDMGFGEVPPSYGSTRSILEIDSNLKKELKEKGFSHRFINYKKYKEVGFHQNHWKPYKRDTDPAKTEGLWNLDAHGFTVYRDLVLAVRPVTWTEAHRSSLKQKNERLSNPGKIFKKDLEDSSNEGGVGSRIVEGYDED